MVKTLLGREEIDRLVRETLGEPPIGKTLPNGRLCLQYEPVAHRPGHHPVAVVLALDVDGPAPHTRNLLEARQFVVWYLVMPIDGQQPFCNDGSYFGRRPSALRQALAEFDRRVETYGGGS